MSNELVGPLFETETALFTCQICDKPFRRIAKHVYDDHQITIYEYVREFPDAQIEARLFTPERAQAIVSGVSRGLTVSQAAMLAKVDVSAVREWMRLGEGLRSTELRKFFLDVKSAETSNYESHLQKVVDAGTEDWRAAAWVLERRYNMIPASKVSIESQVEGTIHLQWNDPPKVKEIEGHVVESKRQLTESGE